MSRPSIVLLPGDGIGPIVLEAALLVLEAVGLEADWVPAEIGRVPWARDGAAVPEATIERLRQHRLGLFGAISSVPPREAERLLPPEHAGRRYTSAILELRRRLGLDVAIRPARSLRGAPTGYARWRGGRYERPELDVTIVMQNDAGHYAGIDLRGGDPALQAVLQHHPNARRFRDLPPEELGASVRLDSLGGFRRAARYAAERAVASGAGTLTVCDKWGVMDAPAQLLLDAAEAEVARHPGLRLVRRLFDAQLQTLVRRPESDRVILTSALVGDVLSDGYAAAVGGVGMVACANLGPDCALFEPLHGSAPKRAEARPPMVDPIGAIRAGALLLEHLGRSDEAAAIEQAIARVVADGRTLSYDLLGLDGDDDVRAAGAADTLSLARAIAAALP